MGDMYGISDATMEANSLHGQIALGNQQRNIDYGNKLTAYKKGIKDTKSSDTTTNESELVGNVSDLQKTYDVGKGIYGGVKGAGEAIASARAGAEATASAVAATGRIASQSAFLAGSGAAMSGRAAAVTEDASASLGRIATLKAGASGVADSVKAGASTLKTAASGFGTGLDATGGAAKTFGELSELGGLSGTEGIVQKSILKLGGKEGLGFVAAKASGTIGGIMDVGKQFDSLIDSGGKSAFTRTDGQGNQVELSTTDKWGEGLTEAGSVLDVVAGFTGGWLAPLAAAVNLAGQATEAVGSIEDEKADNKAAGIGKDGKAGPAPPEAGAPVSEAFTSLGFVGNVNHNPMAHISG
tara:strand:+ start:188 stop:1252 length:1065 start_codon:yes stop_codon:yes gene_type:complete